MALVVSKEFHRNIKAMVIRRSQTPLTRLRLRSSSAGAFQSFGLATTSNCYFQTTTTTTTSPFLKFLPRATALSNFQSRNYSTTIVTFKEYPPHTLFPMPALSPTMESGTISSWQKQEGDSFIAGDVLCSIETDKASVDFEAQDDGVLAKILRQGPTAIDIRIGTPICVVIDDVKDVPAFADYTVEAEATPTPTASTSAAPVAPPTSAAPVAPHQAATPSSPSLLTPSARHLSHSKGLDATTLEGTGKGGRVTKGDFLLALEKGTYMPPLTVAHEKSLSANEAVAPPQPTASSATNVAPPSPPVVPPLSLASLPPLEVSTYGTYNDITNSGMRKVIARRLTESKSQVPHYYTSMEVELDQVLALRKQLAKNHDVKVSVNDLVIRCSAMALRDVPQVNATFDPKSQSIELQSNIDISVAVATPNGLITPIVPNTDRLGLEAISSKVRELAARARDGKLLPHEYQGGTFCVTNLGMFGIDEFSAVINPPQAAILAVGGGSRQVVPSPYVDGAEEQAKPTVKTIMTARLSADRRVVDEPTAALFLSAFRRYINQPELLLL